jgi:hypothetical protein
LATVVDLIAGGGVMIIERPATDGLTIVEQADSILGDEANRARIGRHAGRLSHGDGTAPGVRPYRLW